MSPCNMSADEQKQQSVDRSASDGNLVDAEGRDQFDPRERQVFFTLPRWMSRRRKSRNHIKYIKVDVPLNARDEPRESQKEHEKPSRGFLRRFFSRRGTMRRKADEDTPPRSTSLISASNTDIRNSGCSAVAADYFRDKTPAVFGIRNHGNTCFMNAVLQGLCNTDRFSEYFVMDHYKVDVARRNKIHARKYGTRGEVTEQLALLLKSLWACQYYPEASNKFKALVAKYGTQYEGSNQHDAQEFLLWLLDKVHEDLNTAPKQKYKKPKNVHHGCTPDEVLAAEMLANHLRCNSSFVHDLFQGQFRSSLCCLGCGRFSNTFDPYLCVSLPVPHSPTVPVFLHLIQGNNKDDSHVLKVGLAVDPEATICDLRDALSSNFGASKQSVVFIEFMDGEFQRTFNDTDQVVNLKKCEVVYALETPLRNPVDKPDRERLILVIINRVEKQKGFYETFWRPFVVEVFREASYKEIQREILSEMSDIIAGDIDDTKDLFTLRVIDGVPEPEAIPSSVELPLYMPVVDHALQMCDGTFCVGPRYLMLAAEWPHEAAPLLVTKKQVVVEEHSSVSNFKSYEKHRISLYECFDLYFTEERLDMEDAWMCPHCHRRLPCIKQLSLWSMPDVFIVHLKRFRQSFCQRTKITTFVEFPRLGLNMNAYVATRTQQPTLPGSDSLNAMALWSPWKRSRASAYTKWEDNIFDLYAICNHHGSMQAGHYTAYCKNPVDGHWYSFDDNKVQQISPTDVMTADAYILFYQRSSAVSHSCASSSTSGYSTASSTSSVAPEHWAFRMPPISRSATRTSRSQDNLYEIGNTSSLDRRATMVGRPFSRSSKAYSSMLHYTSRRSLSEGDKDCPNGVIPSILDEIPPPPPPPPPPPAKHYWTITSV